MVYKIYKKDIGARAYQEDNLDIIENDEATLMVLGDGMGGHSGGSKASEILIDTAKETFTQKSYAQAEEFFNTIVKKAHERIKRYTQKSGEDPNSTVAFALITGNVLHYANIGDSRIYIFDAYGLVTRTRDHSIPEMLFQMGEIKEEEMATHPDQNKLTRSLGPYKFTKVSYRDFYLQPDKSYMILVCSDGFWEYVSEYEMFQLFDVSSHTIESRLDELLLFIKKRAKKRTDNISVAIVKIKSEREVQDNGFWSHISMDNSVF